MKSTKAWGVYAKKEGRLTALVTAAPITIISPAVFRTRSLARFYINTIIPGLKDLVQVKRVAIKII